MNDFEVFDEMVNDWVYFEVVYLFIENIDLFVDDLFCF